jgi:predicted NAD/FAD-binding protein
MRIAVVGAGVSGLVAAWTLSREHEVSVFEKDSRVGGHTNTVDAPAGGRTWPVDTGFIVHNRETYPNFTRILSILGVGTKEATMSFSVKCEGTGLEYCPSTFGTLFAQRRNLFRPAFWRMLRDALRFRGEMPTILAGTGYETTLGEYLGQGGYSTAFIEEFLIPMGAAIWSADPERFRNVPLRFFVRFFANHRFLEQEGQPGWRVIEGGSRGYLEPMTATFRDRIATDAEVASIRRREDGVDVHLAGGETRSFDQVVVATHSDQALALLSDPGAAEKAILGAIPYQENDTLLHTDASLLPKRRKAWAAWNFHRLPGRGGRAVVTYDMSILQGYRAPEEFLVTLNREEAVDPSRVLYRTVYHHPVYTAEALAAQSRWGEINGVRRTWFCGAYWGYGFHEDGVNSALAVTRALGMDLPS